MCQKAPVGYVLVNEDVRGASRRKNGTGDGVEKNIATEGVIVDEEVEVGSGGEGKGSKIVVRDESAGTDRWGGEAKAWASVLVFIRFWGLVT